jgi:hypothetical protein
MQELQLQQQELERKKNKDTLDAAAKADELKLREAEINARKETEGARMGIEIQKHKAQLEAQQQTEGTRIGVDIAKHKADSYNQRQSNRQKETSQTKEPK